MVSVSRHPKPDQLGIDAGAAALRMLELLDVERTGTFAEHKTVASFVERTACAARVVIPRRQRLHRIESADPQLRHSRLRTTTQRRIRHPTLDQHQRVANRSEEHTSELQSRGHLVCRLLLEKKKNT